MTLCLWLPLIATGAVRKNVSNTHHAIDTNANRLELAADFTHKNVKTLAVDCSTCTPCSFPKILKSNDAIDASNQARKNTKLRLAECDWRSLYCNEISPVLNV